MHMITIFFCNLCVVIWGAVTRTIGAVFGRLEAPLGRSNGAVFRRLEAPRGRSNGAVFRRLEAPLGA